MPPAPSIVRPAPGPAARLLLSLATAISFLLVIHNFALSLLPERRIAVPTEAVRPFSGAKTFAYVFDYHGSEPDQWPSMRSRVNFFEDGRRYPIRAHSSDPVILAGGDQFTHEPGRIVFSTIDNSDPRKNGRRYSLAAPLLYSAAIGDAAMLVFLGCVGAWSWLSRRAAGPRAPGPAPIPLWRWHFAGATALFVLGLYCNTGTLTPYAITSGPLLMPSTGYAYNGDHVHFRVLYDFVSGKDRSFWDHALLLRRILFPALAWPLMRLFGFELGGTLASLALNMAAFVLALVLIRRWIGERAAVASGWLLALYPGAAYWAGLPYTYSVIFPASLLLMLALWRLASQTDPWRLAGLSLAMGVAYLGYDLAVFFVPATLILLCWNRRYLAAVTSAALQLAPIAGWAFVLSHVFGQPLANPNSGIYRAELLSYLQRPDFAWWLRQMALAPGFGLDTFFSANFLFIPALFLFAFAVNPLTSRIRFHAAEAALLLSGLALFLFLNLSPTDTGGWEMRGTWIARLYQPVFPALVLFVARWWSELPPLSTSWRVLIALAVATTSLGDALVVFGPILDNPSKISELAFYRFYNHTDAHFLYETNLKNLGRRPLGFPRPLPPGPTPAETLALERARLANGRTQLQSILRAISVNRSALAQNQRQYRDVGRALAVEQSLLFEARQELRLARGEITAEQARKEARTWQDFAAPAVLALLKDPSLDAPAAPPESEPLPAGLAALLDAIGKRNEELAGLENSILEVQASLTNANSELERVRRELEKVRSGSPPQKP